MKLQKCLLSIISRQKAGRVPYNFPMVQHPLAPLKQPGPPGGINILLDQAVVCIKMIRDLIHLSQLYIFRTFLWNTISTNMTQSREW